MTAGGRFAYTVSLDVTGRRCVVVGSGALAVARTEALLIAGADVEVVAQSPCDALLALATAATIHRRGVEPTDLDGTFIVIVTGEDPTDVARLWAEAQPRGVLVSVLDDVAHCHFAAPAVVRRGDLTLTVATAGKAPALAKRLRRQLERDIGPEYGELVDHLHAAREAALPRDVAFDVWARRWEAALGDVDALAARVRAGGGDDVRERVLAVLRGDAPRAVPADNGPVGNDP